MAWRSINYINMEVVMRNFIYNTILNLIDENAVFFNRHGYIISYWKNGFVFEEHYNWFSNKPHKVLVD